MKLVLAITIRSKDFGSNHNAVNVNTINTANKESNRRHKTAFKIFQLMIKSKRYTVIRIVAQFTNLLVYAHMVGVKYAMRMMPQCLFRMK